MNNQSKKTTSTLYTIGLIILMLAPIASAITSNTTGGEYFNITQQEITGYKITLYSKFLNTTKITEAGMPGFASTTLYIWVMIDLDDNVSTGISLLGIPSSRDNNRLAYPGVDVILSASYYRLVSVNFDGGVQDTLPNKYCAAHIHSPTGDYLGSYRDENCNEIFFLNPDGNATLYLNWSLLEEQYYEATGVRINGSLHRVYLVYEDPGMFVRERVWYFSNLLVSNFFDTMYNSSYSDNCSSIILQDHNISFTGSVNDWASIPTAYYDGSEGYNTWVPAYMNATRIYLAANSSFFFIGYERAGEFNSSYTLPDRIILMLHYYNNTTTKNGFIKIEHYASGRTRYFIYLQGQSSSSGNLPENYTNFTGGRIAEVAIPQSILPDYFKPSYNVSICSDERLPSYLYTVMVSTPPPPNDNKLAIYETLVDANTGKVLAEGQSTVTGTYVMGSNNTTILTSRDGMKLSVKTGNNTIIYYGRLASPPFNTSNATKILHSSTNHQIYYYTISDVGNVTWPIKLQIKITSQTRNIQGLHIYYYSKSLGDYKLMPQGSYRYDPSTRTLTLIFNKTLYQEGDPGIMIVYNSTSVGGVLLGSSTGLASWMVLLGAAGVGVLIGLFVFYTRRSHKNIFNHI